jgi:deferrochelatase/peroxidase EfeB
MIDLTRPLDLDHPGADAFLRGIQGNIIKGHGRVRTAHILLKMTGDPASVRSWVADFTAQQVTTAYRALQAAIAWRAEGGFGEPFAMFLLAPDGYRYLGFTDEQLPQPDDPFNPPLGAEYFRRGMKRQAELKELRGRSYNDPPHTEWEAPYQRAIHAMILLADDHERRLDRNVADVCASVSGVFEELTIERGKELKRTFTRRGKLTIEHFGFQDGVSQPVMVQQDLDAELARRGGTQWNPGAPLSLALVREPGTTGGYGSFMVFRKLEQNVKAFWQAVDALHGQMVTERPRLQRDDVGALAVGRYPDGIPTLPAPPIHEGADHNDFNFDSDPDGRRCPFHAHIRKTNPRGDIPRLLSVRLAEFERARRIVRRGITYGDRPDLAGGSTLEQPSAGVGLLFMCFQTNLDQFVIQQEGADGNDFVESGVGVDAVIGQNPGPTPQTWPSTGTTTFTMANFVTMCSSLLSPVAWRPTWPIPKPQPDGCATECRCSSRV